MLSWRIPAVPRRQPLQQYFPCMRIKKNLAALEPSDIDDVQLQSFAFENPLCGGNILPPDRDDPRTFDCSREHIGAAEAFDLDLAASDVVFVEQSRHPADGAVNILESLDALAAAILFAAALRQKTMKNSSQSGMAVEHRNRQTRAENRDHHARRFGKMHFSGPEVDHRKIVFNVLHYTFL